MLDKDVQLILNKRCNYHVKSYYRYFQCVDDANDWCFEYLSNCKKKNNNRGLVSNPEVHKTWKFGCVKDNELCYTTLTVIKMIM